ncbi:hypothetical protein FF38_06294 [Lucilia cuprina]|uniref:Uncharacterized protein n=1 Tax=Lucilia cuprina TaxID=7375 RepID=A0A0L0CA61_LUCCU|nr:hypothetical protein FF38_06294 [Lucilia cuprina]
MGLKNSASSLVQKRRVCQISSNYLENSDLYLAHKVASQPARRTDIAKSTQKTILSRLIYLKFKIAEFLTPNSKRLQKHLFEHIKLRSRFGQNGVSSILLDSLSVVNYHYIKTHRFRGIPPKKWSTGHPNIYTQILTFLYIPNEAQYHRRNSSLNFEFIY